MGRHMVFIVVAAWVVAGPVAAQAPKTHEEMQRLHRDPAAYIKALEDPKRDAYQKPHEVLQALELKAGETIADIGAGSGYFALRFSQHVGDQGRVYAVDIEPNMVRHMNRRIRDAGLQNVTTILADPDDPLLAERSIGLFFFCDVWHHVENQTKYLDLIKKMLKPGGQVVMIDFHKKDLPVGPPLKMKIAREELLKQMEQNGFRLAKEHTFLPYQYFLVFTVA